MGDGFRLADLLAALSVAADLGMGHEPEKAIRSCLVATELARTSGLGEIAVRDIYSATLMIHLGCTASMHELTRTSGDDRGVLVDAERTDDTTLRGSLALIALAGRGTGTGRVRHLARFALLATQVVLFDRLGGAAAAVAIVRGRPCSTISVGWPCPAPSGRSLGDPPRGPEV